MFRTATALSVTACFVAIIYRFAWTYGVDPMPGIAAEPCVDSAHLLTRARPSVICNPDQVLRVEATTRNDGDIVLCVCP